VGARRFGRAVVVAAAYRVVATGAPEGGDIVRHALAILIRTRIEWRTRESLASVFVLGVLLLVVFSVAHDPEPEAAPALAPAVLWVTFVFTGPRYPAWLPPRARERLPRRALTAPLDPPRSTPGSSRRTSSSPASAGGRRAAVGLFLHVDLWPVLGGLSSCCCSEPGFAALATLFAAIAVRTRAREVLLPLLPPLLVLLLIGSVEATRAVLAGGSRRARRPHRSPR
jgi:heme exporter protein B